MCKLSTARRVVHGSGIATQSDTSREVDHRITVQTIQFLLVLPTKSLWSRSLTLHIWTFSVSFLHRACLAVGTVLLLIYLLIACIVLHFVNARQCMLSSDLRALVTLVVQPA